MNYILQCHLQVNSHLEVASLINNHFYVDNLLLSSNRVEVLPILIQDINEIMKAGGHHLREWSSNDPELLVSLN